MDPDRHLPTPGRTPQRNQAALMSASAPDPHPRPIVPSASQYQPSLPSIRQLHPYLPPSGMSQPHLPSQEQPTYGYPHGSAYAGPSASTDPHPTQTVPSQSGIYPRGDALDSEPDAEAEQQGPAKKKRRRQALSCNGRSHVVLAHGVVNRQNASGAPWSQSLRDKYVTRAEYDDLKARSRIEYDELKARLDHLESMVSRIFSAPPGAVNVPLYTMSPDMSGAPSSENITSYHTPHSSSSQVLYPPIVPPSTSYQTDPIPKPHQYPTTSPHLMTQATPSSSAGQPPAGGSGPPGHIRRPSDGKSPTTVRQSPLSLASITSPYNPDSQSKNCHAQTLNLLGERLRPAQGGWKGPVVVPPCGTRQRWNTRRQPARRTLWKDRQCHPWPSIYLSLPLGVTESL
ncbi:hypothetical protein F5I97DRAFT_1829671 [Phlebopus sp. FC_14]|nr:hypothetical protein F5I97DRAFT_1829671 [Phlebopus sp. FC_14]